MANKHRRRYKRQRYSCAKKGAYSPRSRSNPGYRAGLFIGGMMVGFTKRLFFNNKY